MAFSFKHALIISSIIHAGILAPGGVALRDILRVKDADMVVDYIVIKDMTNVDIIEKSASLDKKQAESGAQEAKDSMMIDAAAEARATETVAKVEAVKKEIRIRSTRDYMNYYQVIREKIRARLKEKYKDYENEGDVCLVFTLSAEGSLSQYSIVPGSSTDDRQLIDMTTASLSEASPFPPFPKALSLPQMSFSLIVSFKKNK